MQNKKSFKETMSAISDLVKSLPVAPSTATDSCNDLDTGDGVQCTDIVPADTAGQGDDDKHIQKVPDQAQDQQHQQGKLYA